MMIMWTMLMFMVGGSLVPPLP
jgi:hypothetical protein